jgi:hypothetical protein
MKMTDSIKRADALRVLNVYISNAQKLCGIAADRVPPTAIVEFLTDALDCLSALPALKHQTKATHICSCCKNTFLQPFVCTSCGAEKLYDSTLTEAIRREQQIGKALLLIIELASHDADGAIAPIDPRKSWETIAREAMDIARAALVGATQKRS